MRHMETAAHGPGKKLFCRIPHAYATGIYLHQDLPPPNPSFPGSAQQVWGPGHSFHQHWVSMAGQKPSQVSLPPAPKISSHFCKR